MSMGLQGKAKWSVVASGTTHGGDLAGSVKTYPIMIDNKKFTLTIRWTGTPTGTLTVYALSNHDTTPSVEAADNWNGSANSINSLLSPTITQPAGSAGSYEMSSGTWVGRMLYIDYARTSGSGSIFCEYSVLSD
jgi:hypothetical protein